MSDATFEGYAVVELLGHRRLVGEVREVELFGSKVLRLDVALPDGRSWPCFHTAAALYGVVPTTADAITEAVRRENQGNLVRWNLAPEGERADYVAWSAAEEERRRLAWAERNRALLEAPDEDDDEAERWLP